MVAHPYSPEPSNRRAPLHEDGIMGLCVLVFHSSGEPVIRPEEIVCGVPCSSRTEFVVGRSASEHEAFGASTGAPMNLPSSLWHQCALFWPIRDHLIFVSLFQVQLVIVHVSPRLAMYRLKRK